jgi:hypothetical protein
MKEKLFENIGGNRFKLITESVEESKSSLVREGLKKVFASASGDISYKNIRNVGMGYIKDITDATKCSLQEARELASEFGYKDDQYNNKFIKEFLRADGTDTSDAPKGGYGASNAETDMSNPEEKREVQIGEKIVLCVSLLKKYLKGRIDIESGSGTGATLRTIDELANELIKMHGQKV